MTDQAIESPTTMHKLHTRFRTARTLALGAAFDETQGQVTIQLVL